MQNNIEIEIVIKSDDCAESPREWDNLGVMACWHRAYDLGDVRPEVSPEEWLEANAPEGSVVLPLYLYDHSGITISTGSFSCRWDSGLVGYIVATPSDILAKCSPDISKDRVREILESEVKVYDHYLRGNVWGFELNVYRACGECKNRHKVIEESESCWGFFGNDDETLQDIQSNIPDEYHPLLAKAWEDRYSAR